MIYLPRQQSPVPQSQLPRQVLFFADSSCTADFLSSDSFNQWGGFRCDDGHGDYNRSYEQNTDDFDYADYSTAKEDNDFPTRQKKKTKTQKQIIEDILNRWD